MVLPPVLSFVDCVIWVLTTRGETEGFSVVSGWPRSYDALYLEWVAPSRLQRAIYSTGLFLYNNKKPRGCGALPSRLCTGLQRPLVFTFIASNLLRACAASGVCGWRLISSRNSVMPACFLFICISASPLRNCAAGALGLPLNPSRTAL